MPAITKKEELNEDYLSSLKRKDLLNLCKESGIKCVGKNTELIEKLLEHSRSLSKEADNAKSMNPISSHYNNPMTPQKRFDLSFPIVNSPGSSALIKSIVQSARKTGLHSSPVRVPFALSPIAAKLSDCRIHFSPMKSAAKEPSLPIREAFMNEKEFEDSEHNENELQLSESQEGEEQNEKEENSFENKRKHDSLDDAEEDNLHQSKREKLEPIELKLESNEHAGEPAQEQTKDQAQVQEHAQEQTEGQEQLQEQDQDHDHEFIKDVLFDLVPNESFNSVDVEHYIMTDKIESILDNDDSCLTDSTSLLSSTSFSTDLLTNLRDPEFTSPELVSAIDARVSRSEYQDRGRGKSTGKPLLPSGIIKLLEKRRQERESKDLNDEVDHKEIISHNPPTSSASSSSITNPTTKKRFDLKESLKRPLNYKPHIGSLKPKKDF